MSLSENMNDNDWPSDPTSVLLSHRQLLYSEASIAGEDDVERLLTGLGSGASRRKMSLGPEYRSATPHLEPSAV